MKRTAYAFLLSALCAAGCGPSFAWYRGESKNAPHERNVDAPPPAPVMPDQVTPANAHAISQALWDELDYSTRAPVGPDRAERANAKDKR